METAGIIVATLAALAIISSPWIAGRITHYVKIAEFRQAWIIDLRQDIAEFIGAARLWTRQYEELNCIEPNSQKGTQERNVLFPKSNEAFVLLWRIKLRLNPHQDIYGKFYQDLENLIDPSKISPHGKPNWDDLAKNALETSQKMLKEEWEVAKAPPHLFGKF